MAYQDRKTTLCSQAAPAVLTGIDFILVVEPLVQSVLRVFFIIDPDLLSVPMVNPALLVSGPVNELSSLINIESQVDGSPTVEVQVAHAQWIRVSITGNDRTVLEISVEHPGDFSFYQLSINDDRVDRFFNHIEFSFKQACPSELDCHQDLDCPPESMIDVPVDYLARDFTSYRNALLDFAAQRYPHWHERLEADIGVMLLEVMASIGDEFSYIQDRNAREAFLDTASQRRSLIGLARLVDYTPDPGQSATTPLAIGVAPGQGGQMATIGMRAWATPEGEDPIPFELLHDTWLHEAWNTIQLYTPDMAELCLNVGSTEAYLISNAPLASQLPPSAAGEDPIPRGKFWLGRTVILQQTPLDPALPVRTWPVTITSVDFFNDPLADGGPLDITHIRWDVKEALPFELCQSTTVAMLNIVDAIAGEKITEYFRVGADPGFEMRYGPVLNPSDFKKLMDLPSAIEREGYYETNEEKRHTIIRYGLLASEKQGLGWLTTYQPEIEISEVVPDGLSNYMPSPSGLRWNYTFDALSTDAETTMYTIEAGVWRTIVTHQLPIGEILHKDYASNSGYTIRFGAGDFGRSPIADTIFEAIYRTAPGRRANLAANSVAQLIEPDITPANQSINFASWVTNPLAIINGSNPETDESIRRNAPEAFRALPRRAVRAEDYLQILQELDWVQTANAVTAWTGSWSTELLTADHFNATTTLTNDQRNALEAEVDCIRQAGRAAQVEDPLFLSIDLDLAVCANSDAYPGEVQERIINALTLKQKEGKAKPFFDPDYFTFGQSLKRASLEAAVQAVPGVRGVESIRYRARGRQNWRSFTDAELNVAPREILRLLNDPRFPASGSLHVSVKGGS